jgi:hypothetical protein
MWPGSLVAKASSPAVLGHEDRTAAGYPFQHSEDSPTAAELGVSGQLNGAAHPGEFSGFRDDGFIGFQDKFEDGHGGAVDAALHGVS